MERILKIFWKKNFQKAYNVTGNKGFETQLSEKKN